LAYTFLSTVLQDFDQDECYWLGQLQIKYKIVSEAAKSPGEALCRLAEDEQADMIVIGSRGLSAIKRAMIGSVSEYVVRNSGLPCLVVHQKQLTG